MFRLPTGSVIAVLGRPESTETRYWDATRLQPRADAWFWRCGCGAEPDAPGQFLVEGCYTHQAPLEIRAARAARRHPLP